MLTSKDAADSATIVVRPLLATWTATIVQGGRDAVLLRAASDADRLTLAKVLTVAIQVTTTGQHTETWQVIGHQGETTSSSTKGLGTKTISPIVVIGARPTPSPSPRRTHT